MIEVSKIKQNVGEPRRRWFVCDELELVLWCDDRGELTRFELTYDKGHAEHALIWQVDGGFSHMAVDDGERVGGKFKAIPLLIPERSHFPANRVAKRFADSASGLPPDLAEFVETKLKEHPHYVHEVLPGAS